MAKKKTGLYSGMMDIQIYQVYKKTLDEFLRSSDMNLNNKNVVYTIPIYQRGYSWGEEQITSFLERMENIDVEPYYLGLIVVAKEEKKNTDLVELEIVDGQQRLTTYFLLVHCILRKLNPSYEKRDNRGKHKNYKNGRWEYLDEEDKKYRKTLKKFNSYDYEHLEERFMHPEFSFDSTDKNFFMRPLMEKLVFSPSKHQETWNLIMNSHDERIITGEGQRTKSHQTKEWNEIKDNPGISKNDLRLWEAYNQIHQWVDDKYEDVQNKDKNFSMNEFITMCERILLKPGKPTDNGNLHACILVADDIDYGVTIFNQMNSEGLQLGAPDLIKSHLYTVTKKTDCTDDEIKGLMDRWDKLEQKFPAVNSTKNKDFESFLLYDLYVRYNPDDASTPGGIGINQANLSRCYKDLYQDIESVRGLFSDLEKRSEIFIYLKGIKRLEENNTLRDKLLDMNNCLPGSFVQHYPLLIKIIDISSSFKNDELKIENEDDLVKITQIIFSYVFRYALNDLPSNRFRNFMNKMLDKIRDREKNVNNKDKISATMLSTIKKYMKASNHDDISGNKKALESLMSKDKNKSDLADDTCPSDTVTKGALIDNNLKLDIIKGLLMMIERKRNSNFPTGTVFELEHIYPKKPGKNWDQDSKDDLDSVKSQIGNFTILNKSDNCKASNHAWHKKKKDDEGKLVTDTKNSKIYYYVYSGLKVNELLLEHAGVDYDKSQHLIKKEGKFTSKVIEKLTDVYINIIIDLIK